LTVSRWHFEQCLRLREPLAKADPGNAQAQFELMLAQARCGRHAEAAAIAHKLEAGAPDAHLLFFVACGYALSGGAVRASGADPALARRYLDSAFAALTRGVQNGWKDLASLETDPDLEPLRGDARYPALVEQVRRAAGATAKK
jgi:hypothetical protein